MSGKAALAIYVVYRNTRDFPDSDVIVREHRRMPDGTFKPEAHAFEFFDLDGARSWLASRGLTRFDRHPNDDPVILESWL